MKSYEVILVVTPNEDDDPPYKWGWFDLLGCEVELKKVQALPVDSTTGTE